MKTLLLFSVLFSGLSFAQSKDLSKKEAFEAFKNSPNTGNYKFERAYKIAQCFKKAYKRNLRDMPIFQDKINYETVSAMDYQFGGTENFNWMSKEEKENLKKLPCQNLFKD